MKDGLFEASEFESPECKCHCGSCCDCPTWPADAIADRANALLPTLKDQWLAEILKDGVRVYGTPDGHWHFHSNVNPDYRPTHTGIVVKIERIGEK